jgi:hypothetical protein
MVGVNFIGKGANNTGFAKVTIDGDATAADLLQNAQYFVDQAILPDTVLIANGGTLNPTDKIYDNENGLGTVPNPVIFSSTLAAGSHTVKIWHTGYKRAASSTTQIIFTAFIAHGPGLYDTTATHVHMDLVQSQAIQSADEISYYFQPTVGATSRTWLGHTGNAVMRIVPVFTVDGVDRTADLALGVTLTGQKIDISTFNNIRHPQTGATDQGTYDITFTASNIGWTFYHKVVWRLLERLTAFRA